jgi:voltage-gated potassium channel
MKNKNILLFGYGRHGTFLAKGLKSSGFRIKIAESNKVNYEKAIADGYSDAVLLDVTKDKELNKLDPEKFVKLVCVMDDEHLNVFLTLSLRHLFKEANIIAISDSMNGTKKLKMAGATKVIDLYEASANKIYNILKRPVATQLLENFILDDDGINFKEMVIPKESFLIGKTTDNFNFAPHDVLLIGMIDEALGHAFIFVTIGINHTFNHNDTIVCIGPKDKLNDFEKEIKKKESIV